MTDMDISASCEHEARRNYVADGRIDFGARLELNGQMDTELIRGAMAVRPAAQYPHEWILAWHFKVLGSFVSKGKLALKMNYSIY